MPNENETKLYDVFWRENFSNGPGKWYLQEEVAAAHEACAIQIVLDIIQNGIGEGNGLPVDVRVYEHEGLYGQVSYVRKPMWVAA